MTVASKSDEVARDNGDELTWLLNSSLPRDSERRARWSEALARYAIAQRPENTDVVRCWVGEWAPRADAAAEGLGVASGARSRPRPPGWRGRGWSPAGTQRAPSRQPAPRGTGDPLAMPGADESRSWTSVLPLDELWEGDLTGIEVGATKVLLVNVDGQIRAYENRCPHQSWPLDQGDLDCGTLTCANHLWEFDALSGNGINPGDCALTSFPCKVDDDGMICVAVP